MKTSSGIPWRLPTLPDDFSPGALHPAAASTLFVRNVPRPRWSSEIDPPLDLDPILPNGMDCAADRLAAAIRAREPVAIISDYDADGAASAAVMADFFRDAGSPFDIHIADRATEGYGVSRAAIDSASAKGLRVILTLDCGSSSIEALAHAHSLGLEAIIIDHHQIAHDANGEIHPLAFAFVNPMRRDDLSNLQGLSAGGLVYCLARETARRLRLDRDPLEGLDLAAPALTCDVMPYNSANRAMVREGLARLIATPRPGLTALAEVAGLKGPPSARNLGWTFGPRINAAGRLGDAALGWRLLAARSLEEARPIAADLEILNGRRRQAEQAATETAIAAVSETFSPNQEIVSVIFPDIAPGLVGLVASRLREAFGRPAVAFAGSDILSGSARSVPGVDIGNIVRQAAALGLVIRGGGHAGAAGMSLHSDTLMRFLEFSSSAIATIPKIIAEPILQIDAVLQPADVTRDAWRALESLGPFGNGHEPPLIAVPDLNIRSLRRIGDGSHLAIDARSANGAPVRGVAFRAACQPLESFLENARASLPVGNSPGHALDLSRESRSHRN